MSRYRTGFLFSFVYVMYLNIASYLYGKQIKSQFGNKLYLWMIFLWVHLNRFVLHECRTMILNSGPGQLYRFRTWKVVSALVYYTIAFNFTLFAIIMTLHCNVLSFIWLRVTFQFCYILCLTKDHWHKDKKVEVFSLGKIYSQIIHTCITLYNASC